MDKSFYDIYAVVVKILVSKFSHNPKILFGIYGAIWGYFAYKSLFFISKISKDRNKIFIILMLGLCFICNSHININGVRFGTASWVFLASYFGELLNYKGWKYVKYLTPFIHLTFVLPIIIYHIAKIIKNKYNICYIILISSFVLSIIASYSVGAKLFTLFPEDFHFSTYVSQDYVQDYSDNAADRSILTEIFSMIPKIVMLLYLIKSYGNIKFYSVNKNDRFRSTYLFESIHMLLMASFLYLCKLIPDASRFAYIVYPLFIAYILRTKGEPYTKITSRTIIIILYLAFVGSIYKELFWHNYVLNNNYIFSNLYTIISDCSSFVFR